MVLPLVMGLALRVSQRAKFTPGPPTALRLPRDDRVDQYQFIDWLWLHAEHGLPYEREM